MNIRMQTNRLFPLSVSMGLYCSIVNFSSSIALGSRSNNPARIAAANILFGNIKELAKSEKFNINAIGHTPLSQEAENAIKSKIRTSELVYEANTRLFKVLSNPIHDSQELENIKSMYRDIRTKFFTMLPRNQPPPPLHGQPRPDGWKWLQENFGIGKKQARTGSRVPEYPIPHLATKQELEKKQQRADMWKQLGVSQEQMEEQEKIEDIRPVRANDGDNRFALTQLLKGYLEKEKLTTTSRSKVGYDEIQQVGLLIAQDVDVNVRGGPDEQTALHLAVRSKSPELVEALLRRGAKGGIGNKKGKIPLNLAKELLQNASPEEQEKFRKIIKLLHNHHHHHHHHKKASPSSDSSLSSDSSNIDSSDSKNNKT
jgi:hypothetical protein